LDGDADSICGLSGALGLSSTNPPAESRDAAVCTAWNGSVDAVRNSHALVASSKWLDVGRVVVVVVVDVMIDRLKSLQVTTDLLATRMRTIVNTNTPGKEAGPRLLDSFRVLPERYGSFGNFWSQNQRALLASTVSTPLSKQLLLSFQQLSKVHVMGDGDLSGSGAVQENVAELQFGPEFQDIHVLSNAQVAVVLQVSATSAVHRDEELNDVYRKTQKYVNRFNSMTNPEKDHQEIVDELDNLQEYVLLSPLALVCSCASSHMAPS
jgi:hypothetical protein